MNFFAIAIAINAIMVITAIVRKNCLYLSTPPLINAIAFLIECGTQAAFAVVLLQGLCIFVMLLGYVALFYFCLKNSLKGACVGFGIVVIGACLNFSASYIWFHQRKLSQKYPQKELIEVVERQDVTPRLVGMFY